MKIFKTIMLAGFLAAASFFAYLITVNVGWGNFFSTLYSKRPEFLRFENNPDPINEQGEQKDTVVTGGYTDIEKFDNNLEPFPDDEAVLYYYYKYPLTKSAKENYLADNPLPKDLEISKLRPTDDDAQAAFNYLLRGRLTDMLERGLRFRVGKCYKNTQKEIHNNLPCVTCNVSVFTQRKEDAVKAIHSFPSKTYDFVCDEGDFPKWEVQDHTINIPLDYEFYEQIDRDLDIIHFEIKEK